MQERVLATSTQPDADRFGLPVAPKYFDNIERYRYPESRQRLDATSAGLLLKYMEAIDAGLRFPDVIHQTAVILWLIDCDANVWFCIEEMYKEDSGSKILPRIDNVEYPRGYEKLGHPALVLADKARIGGEIKRTSGLKTPSRWYISNKSGRYGIRPDIKLEHLEAANTVFGSYGITFDVHFIPHPEK